MTTPQQSAAVSIEHVISTLPGPFQQRDLVTANDTIVRIALFEGEFAWHEHEEDELFLCWDGTFRIEIEGRDPVTLGQGELFVVPKGTRHRPVAETRARPDDRTPGDEAIRELGDFLRRAARSLVPRWLCRLPTALRTACRVADGRSAACGSRHVRGLGREFEGCFRQSVAVAGGM